MHDAKLLRWQNIRRNEKEMKRCHQENLPLPPNLRSHSLSQGRHLGERDLVAGEF
jgi:hypothetical protein